MPNKTQKSKSTYLGDGVYAAECHYTDLHKTIVLTTGHHDPKDAENIIYLEPETIQKLQSWLKQTGGE